MLTEQPLCKPARESFLRHESGLEWIYWMLPDPDIYTETNSVWFPRHEASRCPSRHSNLRYYQCFRLRPLSPQIVSLLRIATKPDRFCLPHASDALLLSASPSCDPSSFAPCGPPCSSHRPEHIRSLVSVHPWFLYPSCSSASTASARGFRRTRAPARRAWAIGLASGGRTPSLPLGLLRRRS